MVSIHPMYSVLLNYLMILWLDSILLPAYIHVHEYETVRVAAFHGEYAGS